MFQVYYRRIGRRSRPWWSRGLLPAIIAFSDLTLCVHCTLLWLALSSSMTCISWSSIDLIQIWWALVLITVSSTACTKTKYFWHFEKWTFSVDRILRNTWIISVVAAAKSQTRLAGQQNETIISLCGACCDPLHKSDIKSQFEKLYKLCFQLNPDISVDLPYHGTTNAYLDS